MQPEVISFQSLLKQHGYSLTAPRFKLFTVLQNHNACTIKQLVAQLGEYDRATIYRTVKLFEQLSIVKRLQLGWRYKLELSDAFHHHHHHLSCVRCGRVMVLREDPMIEDRINRLSLQYQFQSQDHQLEIRGLCRYCKPIN